MNYLLQLVAAMAVSLAVIPLMVRLAPALGMIDQPDERKVHATPVPRVGGWGIFVGTILVIAYVLPASDLVHAYLLGALVLFVFGAIDDRREAGHWFKFLGQIIAATILVVYGDIYVTQLPFFEEYRLPYAIAAPFTIIAMIGVINALNHSDGLDGLASGEALLSLLALGLLFYIVGGRTGAVVALATVGGTLGFLRYNTHPATVFMGDGGSQFLGYTLAFLATYLTQHVDPALSPSVVLLLLGLPVVDIIVVLKKRIQQGSNWFRATRNHVHHRLLDVGFVHQESVVIIYSVHTVLVTSGLFLRYQPDWLILVFYAAIVATLFVPLNIAERTGWRPGKDKDAAGFHHTVSRARHLLLVVAPRRFLDIALPAYLVGGSLLIREVPTDIGLVGALVFTLLIVEPLFNSTTRSIMRRSLIYIIAAIVVFMQLEFPRAVSPWLSLARPFFFALTALSVAAAIRFSPRRRKFEFHPTAMDYLMVVMIVVGLGYSYMTGSGATVGWFVVRLIVLWYACELLIIEKRERWNTLTVSVLVASGILAYRGFF